jgi:hypothetical protein
VANAVQAPGGLAQVAARQVHLLRPLVAIIGLVGQASTRWGRLSSNVRPGVVRSCKARSAAQMQEDQRLLPPSFVGAPSRRTLGACGPRQIQRVFAAPLRFDA